MQIPLWLKIQRVSLFFFLASGVLLLIYALGFISDVYLFFAYGNRGLVEFYNEMQAINAGLLWKAVMLIIFAIVLFLLQLDKHPAGLITLILTLLILAASIVFCAGSLLALAEAREKYTALDLSSLNRYIERGAIQYEFSTLTYDLGLAGYALLCLASLFTASIVIRNAIKVEDKA